MLPIFLRDFHSWYNLFLPIHWYHIGDPPPRYSVRKVLSIVQIYQYRQQIDVWILKNIIEHVLPLVNWDWWEISDVRDIEINKFTWL